MLHKIVLEFHEIFLEFREIQIISSKFRVSQNLHNAVSQQPYAGVEEDKGGSGWEVGGSGGGPGSYRLATLPANADCAYIGVQL